MSDTPKLTIELVPESCWFTNLRSELPPSAWDLIRRTAYRRARHRCEVCGGVGPQWPVEAHEEWTYISGVQRLRRVVALCPACHEVKHIGLAGIKGRDREAVAHLMKVNDWDPVTADRYIKAAFRLWFSRSRMEWRLDIKDLYEWLHKKLPHLDLSHLKDAR